MARDDMDPEIGPLVARIAGALLGRGEKLATAESCTGGWLAKCLTDRPGSSDWFEYGVVAYANRMKVKLLRVQRATLIAHGAVSEPVAREMALGARRASGADFAVAITGVAGPGGGTEDKPVGTVWIALAGPATEVPPRFRRRERGLPEPTGDEILVDARCHRFRGDREAVRRQAVVAALRMVATRIRAGVRP